MLVRAGTAPAAGHDLAALRHASVGEPLNPEVVTWDAHTLGKSAHDTWWQTETGVVMVANYASQPIRSGSLGRPVPGIDIALVRHDQTGERLLAGVRCAATQQVARRVETDGVDPPQVAGTGRALAALAS